MQVLSTVIAGTSLSARGQVCFKNWVIVVTHNYEGQHISRHAADAFHKGLYLVRPSMLRAVTFELHNTKSSQQRSTLIICAFSCRCLMYAKRNFTTELREL